MANLCLHLHSFSIQHILIARHTTNHGRVSTEGVLVLKEPSQDTSVESYVGVWDASTSLSTAIVTTPHMVWLHCVWPRSSWRQRALCASCDPYARCEGSYELLGRREKEGR